MSTRTALRNLFATASPPSGALAAAAAAAAAAELSPSADTERQRIQQLYLRGLPRAAFDLIALQTNRNPCPPARAPLDSPRAPDLDDRLSHASARLATILGTKDRDGSVKEWRGFGNKTTFTLERRGQHVPVGVVARDIRARFWQRMYKGAVKMEEDEKKRKAENSKMGLEGAEQAEEEKSDKF